MSREYKIFNLRMPPDLRALLDEAARQGKRSINQEIIERLERSMQKGYPTAPQGAVLVARENQMATQLSELDSAMLLTFRNMPIEKRLALLSLFK